MAKFPDMPVGVHVSGGFHNLISLLCWFFSVTYVVAFFNIWREYRNMPNGQGRLFIKRVFPFLISGVLLFLFPDFKRFAFDYKADFVISPGEGENFYFPKCKPLGRVDIAALIIVWMSLLIAPWMGLRWVSEPTLG